MSMEYDITIFGIWVNSKYKTIRSFYNDKTTEHYLYLLCLLTFYEHCFTIPEGGEFNLKMSSTYSEQRVPNLFFLLLISCTGFWIVNLNPEI